MHIGGSGSLSCQEHTPPFLLPSVQRGPSRSKSFPFEAPCEMSPWSLYPTGMGLPCGTCLLRLPGLGPVGYGFPGDRRSTCLTDFCIAVNFLSPSHTLLSSVYGATRESRAFTPASLIGGNTCPFLRVGGERGVTVQRGLKRQAAFSLQVPTSRSPPVLS